MFAIKPVYLSTVFILLAGMIVASLFVGAGQVTLDAVWCDPIMRDIFLISRVPRTLALLLARGQCHERGGFDHAVVDAE